MNRESELESIDEEPAVGADEMLDWLCWRFATQGERFYPVEETAQECMGSLDMKDENDPEALGWERGTHHRAYLNAVMFFHDLERHGYEPIERAKREVRRARQEGLDNLEMPSFAWYYNSHYGDTDE